MIIVIRDEGGRVAWNVDTQYGIDFLAGTVYWTDSDGGDHETPVENVVRILKGEI